MQHLSRDRRSPKEKEKVMVYDFSIPRSEMERLIDEWVLNEQYRNVIKLRFLDGLTFERIAERVSMSERQVKRIVYKYGDRVLTRVPK